MVMTMLNLPNYRQTDQIYAGNRTLVYRAIQVSERQPVIIKLLRHSHPNFHELLQFRNQYVISSHLQHPSIVQPLALERYENSYALVMPDEGAIALSDYWQHSSQNLTAFLNIAIQLASALHYLIQQRIIHKDIKPANILIHPETNQVKLIDFSMSSLLPKEQQQLTNPNVLEGTLAYISPEQTGRMNRGIDYRTDFYSLGVTFFELLTGELPFVSDDPMELVHCHIAKLPIFPQTRYPIPNTLSDIVMKLMAKNAEDRYQSALGLKHDLEQCWQQWENMGEIRSFELGKRDICDRFLIPEKLYGRDTEVQTLLNAFERVANGATEMMLVAGFSGIGKTAIINEVHKPIVKQRGYFIKGKFDQFNRNIPFSAFVQAFRDLMRQLLGESDADLAKWKAKILKALGDNASVIIEVLPELEAIVGQQPPALELSDSAAQNRFNLLLQKFIGVFTAPEHPLVMFLDDLQWADSASLNLLKVLMSDTHGYLLLLGAYRDNEVFPAHPLMLSLAELEKNEAVIATITLEPLPVDYINQLVAETLTCSQELAQPLTELVYQKTHGNPFFTTQFLKGLHEDSLIVFNLELGYWECDLIQLHDATLTDDVVEFMARRLQKLPEATQKLLKLAACIGNQFELETLAVVCEESLEEVATDIWGALQEGLILPVSEAYKFFQGCVEAGVAKTIIVSYRFSHDRVQQAAYSLIPDHQKETTHYHIGQLLLQKIPQAAREERIFELVNQLNYGTALITAQTERDQLAKLNLIACRKAKSATAHQAGREYASIGLALLGKDAWQSQYEMNLAFHDLLAELAALCGDFETMEQFVETVIQQAGSLLEKVNVYRMRILANFSQNKLTEAIAIVLELLEQFGVRFPQIPTPNDIQQEIAAVEQLIGDREIADLLHLPAMTDREKIAIIQIVRTITPAAFLTGSSLYPLLVSFSVKLSIQYGNTLTSGYSYANYGIITCNLLQDVNTGVKFGQLALQLVSKLDAKAVKPEVFLPVGLFILHRKSHIKETRLLLQEGYTTALEIGNQEMAGHNAHGFCFNSFWGGQPLINLEEETRAYYHGLVQLNQLITANFCRIYWQPILNLLGTTDRPTLLSGEAFQESEFLPQLVSTHNFYGLYCFYLYKLMLCYLFGELESAQNHAVEIRRYLMTGTGKVSEPAFYFYDSLTILAALSPQSDARAEAFQRVEQNQTQLQQQWAHYAPMNHQHKVDLVEAEKYRVLGKKTEAIELYDKAICGAKANEYIQEEALANELAAKFYLDWGKEKIAASYMQESYYCYAHWGAKAKTDQLESTYAKLLNPILQKQWAELNYLNSLESLTKNLPFLGQTQAKSSSTSISDALDFASILQAAQSLSSTIELDQLLSNIVQIVLTNAGAQKAALLIPHDDQWQIRAIAQLTTNGTIETNTHSELLSTKSPVPIRLVQYIKNTLETVIIDAGKTKIAGILEGYLLEYQPQSLLCTPLLDRGNLVAILYLEHLSTKGVFTHHRQTIIQFLCAQAAIALQNAQLYDQTQQALQDLKHAQLQLVQSEKMSTLGNLVSGVAHEINNPMSFLQGNIEPAQDYVQDLLGLIDLYQQKMPNPDDEIEAEIEEIDLEFIRADLPKLLDSMNIGVERIGEISNSLRTFSRKDLDHRVSFNIHEGIDSTILILKHRTKANEQRPAIQMIKDYEDIPDVKCFPGQLNQVFMNILANAIDALEETNQGKTYEEIEANPNSITIHTSIVDDRVQIQIQDNGSGMKPETKDRIFEQGFTTKEVGKGTGLGMAIAHQIITEKHQGTLTCDSTLLEGTTFTITLPIA